MVPYCPSHRLRRGGDALGGLHEGPGCRTDVAGDHPEGVACGFPSPAEDHLERPLDLNELHGIGSPSVFLVRVAGESMIGRGLFPGDVAVVDKAKPPRNGCIVVACLNGDFTMKTYHRRGERVTLKAENPAFPNIEVPAEADFQVWGVVTGSSRTF